MALDGIFLKHVKNEISKILIGSKINKIYQPSKEEIVLLFRTKNEQIKLLICVRADSCRINITNQEIENPKTPSMLCMLFRKKLTGAKLVAIEQDGLERIVVLKFEAINSLGDKINLSLIIELMGKYSNVILTDENSIIIDSLKRVDDQMSSVRIVLPGIKYEAPPKQDKLCVIDCDANVIIENIINKRDNICKSLMRAVQGISPVVAREIEYILENTNNINYNNIVREQLLNLIYSAKYCDGTPNIVIDNSGKPIEFSFMPIHQYENLANCLKRNSFSELLDEFFLKRDNMNRMKSRSHDLSKNLSNIRDRLVKKLKIQKQELINSVDRNKYKQYADIINANLYCINKGMSFINLDNFYDGMKPVSIKLNPLLTPSQNAQLYYKKYRKAYNAEKALKLQMEKAQIELTYIESVMEVLDRATSNEEIDEIRSELFEQGYIKISKGKRNKFIKTSFNPIEFITSEGFKVLVGKNNKQNDILTLKKSSKNDIWFHTKNMPGSHTVLITDGRQPRESSIIEAATIAARYSKAKDSSNVPVDYTIIKNVSKPQGAKPGMVIYVKYKTIYVTP